MYRRIAVPLDDTWTSRQALPWALTIAREARCPIDLVRVAFPAALGTELYGAAVLQPRDIEEMRRAAQVDLQSLADEITAAGIAATSMVLTGGAISDALVEQLRTRHADLVVMATHDAGRVEHLLLGSVADSVVRHVHIPVLLVRPEQVAPSFESPRMIERMLIPLDGSSFGEEIIRHAATLASLLKSDIVLLAVLPPIVAAATTAADVADPSLINRAVNSPNHQEIEQIEQVESQTAALERIARPLRSAGLVVHTVVLADTQAGRAIVDYTKRQSIDAIAMTTHGRGALKRIIAGSVSQRVLRTSHVPMLVYRPATS